MSYPARDEGLGKYDKIFSQCNESDIKKLPNLVKGITIKPSPNYALNCDKWIQGKRSHDRNKTLDCKATNVFPLVLGNLGGPNKHLVKDGYTRCIR